MAGWSFVVTTQSRAEYARHIDRDAILAHWKTGAFGIRWVERLADEGRAERVEEGGYPSVYAALARDVVPLFGPDGPPAGGERPGSSWEVRVQDEGLRSLAPDARLTVVVWDQS